ncbi:C2 domain protein [Teladorsagia circumcincta]|uniref:C2 domain protein n=1 Tax=Teladorsagia circumcincta TaxID=45464 RepID=A0A2G9UEZ8_TELCI|nr:C2 domain protein [Teladorsagia circumcincta]
MAIARTALTPSRLCLTSSSQFVLDQTWTSVVNVVLVEGRNLNLSVSVTPPDPYCKFKLGCEKYKSKDTSSALLLLITVSGSHSKDSVVDLTEFNHNDVRNSTVQRYDLLHTFDDLKDVGELTVKVFRAEDLLAKDLGGKSDPFAVLELVNTRLQTHTEYKTLNPQWNKLFTFCVKDIHTCLEVTVYDEDPNNKFEFLGKVSIPLLSSSEAAGADNGPTNLSFQPLTLEKRQIFVIGVYFFELYHAPLLLLVLFAKCLVYKTVAEDLTPRLHEQLSSKDDDDNEEEKEVDSGGKSPTKPLTTSKSKDKESSSSTIRDTLSSVQETLAVVQNTLVFICALLQRVRNSFNFTQPWLSWLAVGVLTVATILLYFVPLRWIIMVWGINKFTKKLRNPHYIDNNEVLDYLSRVPCDKDLMEWREFSVTSSSNGKEKERTKSKDK